MIKLKDLLTESFVTGKGWSVHAGTDMIIVTFDCGKKLSFDINFSGKKRNEHDKVRKQSASKWATIAKEIYKNPELNKVGDPIQKSWEQCFAESLFDQRLLPFVKKLDRSPVF